MFRFDAASGTILERLNLLDVLVDLAGVAAAASKPMWEEELKSVYVVYQGKSIIIGAFAGAAVANRDGKTLAVAAGKRVLLVNFDAGGSEVAYALDSSMLSVRGAYISDAGTGALLHYERPITMFDSATGSKLGVLAGGNDSPNDVVWALKDAMVLIPSANQVQRYNVDRGTLRAHAIEHGDKHMPPVYTLSHQVGCQLSWFQFSHAKLTVCAIMFRSLLSDLGAPRCGLCMKTSWPAWISIPCSSGRCIPEPSCTSTRTM